MKQVYPNSVKAWNVSWNLNLFSGPKATINCGNCGNSFEKRIMLHTNRQNHKCPYCGAINVFEAKWE